MAKKKTNKTASVARGPDVRALTVLAPYARVAGTTGER